jgi:hypothetical protein
MRARRNQSVAHPAKLSKDDRVIAAVQRWVKSFVVDMNLCPFAKRELSSNRVRFASTAAKTEEELLLALQTELELLDRDTTIATTLLVHADVLQDFDGYNQFLNYADALLRQTGLEGVYQIASFHPDYRFAGAGPDDAENYTNRSPYPLLHIIREESLARAIAQSTDVDQVPARNIALMNQLGRDRLSALLQACIDVD